MWDMTWLQSKGISQSDLQRIWQPVNLQIQKSNDLMFYDDHGNATSSFQIVRHSVYPAPPKADIDGKLHWFNAPTFVYTGDPIFPRLKLDAILIRAMEIESLDWFRVSAVDVVKAIMTNVLTGEQWVFNNELQRDGTFTITVPFPNPKDLRKTN